MPDQQQDKEKLQKAPALAIAQYCKTLTGLRTTFFITVPLVANLSIKADKNLETFVDNHGIPRTENDSEVSFAIPVELSEKANRFFKAKEHLDVAYFHLPRALAVSLVSAYDAYLSALLKAIFLNKPEMVEGSARQFTFKELAAFGSIDAARNYLVEKEVEGVIRDSHIKQFDWLENKFGIPLRSNLPSWSTFVEVTERRNLYVHADAMVSDQYLSNCSKHGASIEGLNAGDPLPPLTPKYFMEAWSCVFEIGTKLGHVLWRKATGDLKSSDDELIDCIFNLLGDEDYELAAELGSFATKVLPRHASELNRRVLLVNYCIALRFGGKPEECANVLDAEDWSGTEEMFQIAHAVLKQDFEKASEIMKTAGNNHKKLTRHNYERWPLFKEFRRSENFLSTYRELFGREYEVPEATSAKDDSQEKRKASKVSESLIRSIIEEPDKPAISDPDHDSKPSDTSDSA